MSSFIPIKTYMDPIVRILAIGFWCGIWYFVGFTLGRRTRRSTPEVNHPTYAQLPDGRAFLYGTTAAEFGDRLRNLFTFGTPDLPDPLAEEIDRVVAEKKAADDKAARFEDERRRAARTAHDLNRLMQAVIEGKTRVPAGSYTAVTMESGEILYCGITVDDLIEP